MTPDSKVALLGMLLAASLFALPAASASGNAPGSQVASTLGPHTIWWASSVWNNRVPGNEIRYLLLVYDENYGTSASNATMTITSLSLQTPWGNYTATGLPTTICLGCRYAWAQFLTIPTTQSTPANVTFYTRLTGTYGSATPLCTDTNKVCEDITPVTVVANPSTIQTTLNSYADLYLPVGVLVPSLIAVVLLVLYMRKRPA